VGGEGISTCYRRDERVVRVVEEEYTHLSILGIIAIVQVVRVGNKVECGVVFEGGTCIQQRARMLSARSVGLDEGEAREIGLLTSPDFFSFLPHVSQVGRPWKEP